LPKEEILTNALMPDKKGQANLWSVRMNASRDLSISALSTKRTHISGAEGIYGEEDLSGTVFTYIQRALGHSRGVPDNITINIQRLKIRPMAIRTLPVHTLMCGSSAKARKIASSMLVSLGITHDAVNEAFKVLRAKSPMRGAAVIDSHSGERLEPDKQRGLRASRMGIERTVLNTLRKRLLRLDIDFPQVREALVLASKVATTEGLVAELCASDDPDYTTGYVASGKFGYVRIPNIKKSGSKSGGRAFFVRTGADMEQIAKYIEDTPVIITEIASVKGEVQHNEFIRNNNS
jgi:6-carboxyhexanoate--CoA ligase